MAQNHVYVIGRCFMPYYIHKCHCNKLIAIELSSIMCYSGTGAVHVATYISTNYVNKLEINYIHK